MLILADKVLIILKRHRSFRDYFVITEYFCNFALCLE